jgi:hypothetical protein
MMHTRAVATIGRRAVEAAQQRRFALQRWDGEGGAVVPVPSPTRSEAPAFADAELVQLRMRVVALEGLVLVLLAQGPASQRAAAARMADHILPRPGRTQHPLTVRAAARIRQLVARARRLASARPAQ